MADEQEQWLIDLEKENNERLAQLAEDQLAKDKLHAIKAEEVREKTLAAEKFNIEHPRLSFLKRYNVIIIMLLGVFITAAFNISMFIG